MKEIWRNIPDYNGVYQASNAGKIRSLYIGTKLTINNTEKIIRRLEIGHSITSIAKDFNVSYQHIWQIKRKNIDLRPKILKAGINTNGYKIVVLCKNKDKKTHTVHKLILTTFVGEKPKNMECRHLDGNKLNNELINLRWGTRHENAKDKFKHNTFKSPFKNNHKLNRGEKHPNSKLTEHQILEIRQLLKNKNLSQAEIGRMFNINRGHVWAIKNRKLWKHVKEK